MPYMTLYTTLVTVCKLSAPFIPFMTEEIYQNLVCSVDKKAPESVHLCDFPTYEEAKIDASLEENMDAVLKVVTLATRMPQTRPRSKTASLLISSMFRAQRWKTNIPK